MMFVFWTVPTRHHRTIETLIHPGIFFTTRIPGAQEDSARTGQIAFVPKKVTCK